MTRNKFVCYILADYALFIRIHCSTAYWLQPIGLHCLLAAPLSIGCYAAQCRQNKAFLTRTRQGTVSVYAVCRKRNHNRTFCPTLETQPSSRKPVSETVYPVCSEKETAQESASGSSVCGLARGDVFYCPSTKTQANMTEEKSTTFDVSLLLCSELRRMLRAITFVYADFCLFAVAGRQQATALQDAVLL